jgi:hypothetical protein
MEQSKMMNLARLLISLLGMALQKIELFILHLAGVVPVFRAFLLFVLQFCCHRFYK